MVTTPSTIALEKGAVKPAQPEQTASNKATTLIESLIQTPSLPSGTTISPQLQQVGTNELITTPGVSGQVVAATPTVTAAPTIAGAAPTAAQVTTATTITTTPIPSQTMANALKLHTESNRSIFLSIFGVILQSRPSFSRLRQPCQLHTTPNQKPVQQCSPRRRTHQQLL